MAGRELPSPAVLGLKGEHAATDLEYVGLDTEALRFILAGSGDPDLALNALRRLMDNLSDQAGAQEEFIDALRADMNLATRIFALLGGSTALGDHLIATPMLWKEIGRPVPTQAEFLPAMLSAVDAQPAGVEGDSASEDLSSPGTYRAGNTDLKVLKSTYRTLLMRIAANDLAGTFAARRGYGAGCPRLGYTSATGLLTALADAALTAALAVAVSKTYGDDVPNGHLSVIAMGKCGARELNYISDVDVIFVAEEIDAKVTRLASEFMRIGSSSFFEVDANLRPEGRSGALVRTLDSHVTYYKRWAETWEFQAQLKARPMTGDMKLGQSYIDSLTDLVWSASQRESFVDDIQAMRRRVIDNVPADLRDRELKLGRGGLRDVEFAVQLLQMVHGRSDHSLRVLSTIEALDALVAGGYVGREDGKILIEAYELLRLYEHRLQLQRLRRTHALPPADDHHSWSWLAATAGYISSGDATAVENLQEDLRRVRREVADLHSSLFYRPLLDSVVTIDVATLRLTPDAARAQLAALGYQHPARAVEHLSALAAGNTRKAKLQAILLPTLMDYLSDTADPDAGLLNYRKLSEAAHDRSWFLRMLRDEGVVARRLMFILGTSQYTADLMISAPDVVRQLGDGATGPKLLETEADRVYKAVIASAKRHLDPDVAVSRARSLRRLDLARIASADLLGFMDTAQVCEELSYVWLAVLEAALRAEVRASLSSSELENPPARIAIIGMGRLGGRELGYGSDADVMVVAEPSPGVETPEALSWAASIIEGMRSRLAKPSHDPPLEVDLGLRPEGRSGAVVRTIESYERYYRQWGESWELQALLRASHVAGDEEVGTKFLETIDVFRYPDDGASKSQIMDIRRMKARVDDERLPRGADKNTHTKLGRGALTDIEWTVQLLTLEHAHENQALHNTSTLEVLNILEELDDSSIISAQDAATLREAWLMATKSRNAIVLVRGKRRDQLPQPGPELARIAGAAGWDPTNQQDFLETYLRLTRHARSVVDQIFWGEQPSLGHV